MNQNSFLPSTYTKLRDRNRLSQLIVLLSFLISFIVIRAVTYLQYVGIIPDQAEVLHIHHMVPGIILVLVSGYIGISFWSHTKTRLFTSILFGIGAALTIDEFALWLFLKDVYWEKQGRTSVDAIIVAAIIMTIIFVISEVHEHVFIKKVLRKNH